MRSSDTTGQTNTTQLTPTPVATQEASAPETVNGCTRTYDAKKFEGKTVEYKNKVATVTVKGFGTFTVELNDTAAPKTVENFVKLAESGFYNCLTFHRVAKDFVVQGGDPAGNGTGGPGYTVPAEIKLPHTKGAIAMARTGDQVNPERASSGSQFYIALQALPMLDGAYTVFGQVASGMDVVEKVGKVEILGGQDGPPKEPVVIESITITNK
ncbi:MAG: peptidylprolyl isomerase [Candidatus Doudnabacteria bacterium]|nr:peptidylprolyl isomerase [Candidatus Doudnabacteria bacterium]